MLKLITSSRHFVSTLLAAVANNVRQRFVCKPFNIWEEKICDKGKNQQDWLGDDGVLYYGTERIGQLRIGSPNGQLSEPIQGVPEVFFEQQGGLLDVAIDPEFSKNRLIYLSYDEPEGNKAITAVARAELS